MLGNALRRNAAAQAIDVVGPVGIEPTTKGL